MEYFFRAPVKVGGKNANKPIRRTCLQECVGPNGCH
jgi:hypothetical protein